uniref:PUM-HD domain-containing protein n=1 Tax=Pyrodinium bahamense TaxID=73915 RepID=A0A7S0BCI0_9DINO|mmetsp:Transcript_9242/g.25850  ORF Transcript_9242/g.25850 Transcript_9242/m.25850 type:complete len:468 (+) Transcript_9242:39-1442(+)
MEIPPIARRYPTAQAARSAHLLDECMAPWTGHAAPHPARAIRLRLQQAADLPSWASYLPPPLQRDCQSCSESYTTVAGSPSSMHDGAVVETPALQQLRDAKTSRTRTTSPSSKHKVPVCNIALQPLGCVLPSEAFILPPSADICGVWSPRSGTSHSDEAERVDLACMSAVPERNEPATARGVCGRVWKLSQDPVGCQEVQRAFEEAASEDDRVAIAVELRGHVWEALRCPHANYVLQKCIVTMTPQHTQFVIDELGRRGRGGACQAARHCFGCRIVERLLERCPPAQVQRLTEALLDDALALSAHRYGNYVVQHLLEHGTPAQQQHLAALLAENAQVLGANCYTSAVLIKALSWGPPEGQVLLARALLSVPGLFSTMARTRHGRLAAKLVLKVLEVPGELDSAVRHLTTEAASFRASVQRAKADGDQRPARAARAVAGCAAGGKGEQRLREPAGARRTERACSAVLI